VGEDRDEAAYSKQSSEQSWAQQAVQPKLPDSNQNVTSEEMINITSCNLDQFGAYMSKQYGSAQFQQGFELIKKNQDLIYVDDGEEKLVKMLNKLFSNEDTIRGFINFCTTFLIVQNMQYAQ